jgi:hypothetical protein
LGFKSRLPVWKAPGLISQVRSLRLGGLDHGTPEAARDPHKWRFRGDIRTWKCMGQARSTVAL